MFCRKSDSDSITKTVEVLKKGGVVILPTDTVYGFSGLVDFETDVEIRKIKGRSETKPLIQLIAKPEDLFLYTDDEVPQSLLKNWPGALTIIVHIREDNPYKNKASFSTVAFRCPGDSWLREIISQVGQPIFSTSVNRSGEPVLDEEKSILKEFEDEVALIVTDGDKKNALPSTLVSIEDGQVKILRQGALKINL